MCQRVRRIFSTVPRDTWPGPFPHDSKTPRALCWLGLADGDDGPDHTNVSLVGVEGLNHIRVPQLDMLFLFVGEIIVGFAGRQAVPRLRK